MNTPGEALRLAAEHLELWFNKRYPKSAISAYITRNFGERFFDLVVCKEDGFLPEDMQVFKDMDCFLKFKDYRNKQGAYFRVPVFRFHFEVTR